MEYWQGPARWINTILLAIVGFIGFATLFDLLDARDENVIVRFVAMVAGWFLAPFEGMFDEQEFLLTAIIAVLGYSLLAGIALAVARSIRATRQEHAARRGADTSRPAAERPPTPSWEDDRTRRL